MSGIRTFLAVSAALALTACGNDFVPPAVTTGQSVVTYYEPGHDYGAYATYAIVSRVGFVDSSSGTPVYSWQEAPEVLAAVERNMGARGYVLVATVDPTNPPPAPPDADLAITVLGLVSTSYTYYPCDYWNAWGYPSYDCTHPWEWVAYQTGLLLVDMGDLRAIVPGNPPKVPSVWAAGGYSVLTAENSANTSLAVRAIDQAFAQSPYLKTP